MRGNPYSGISMAFTAVFAGFISGQAKSATLCRDCEAPASHWSGQRFWPLSPMGLIPTRNRAAIDRRELFLDPFGATRSNVSGK